MLHNIQNNNTAELNPWCNFKIKKP